MSLLRCLQSHLGLDTWGNAIVGLQNYTTIQDDRPSSTTKKIGPTSQYGERISALPAREMKDQ
jgi:hypothetical protein